MKLDWVIMPGPKIQAEIMQTTTGFHDCIAKALFPISDFVFDDAVAFDPANRMFHADAQGRQPVIEVFVPIRKRVPTRFFLWLQDGHVFQGKALKPGILRQATARWQGVATFIGQFFVMGFPSHSLG